MKLKTPKYKNRKIENEDGKFDSAKEYRRFKELQILQRAGVISGLTCQAAYVLAEPVKFSGESRAKPALRYVADFQYVENGKLVVEDVKSKITKENPVFRIKKHLMMSVHGIEIKEV